MRPQAWISPNSPKHFLAPFANSSNSSSLPYTQEPPVLQNPERVVRHTESERFERSYQPNVALAPRQTIIAREQRDKEDNNTTSAVIKSEMQIKQERPSTPINESSPTNMRNSSPETTINGGNMPSATAPISPEGQSGSNEITSSTSPVPASIPNIKQDSVSPHSSPSLTSPPPRSHMIHHKSSPVVVTVVTNNHHHHHHQPVMNGIKKKVPLGQPEFEMSTDTDEESLTGEPDSSNLNGSHTQTAYEHVRELLNNNTLENHNRILHIFKYMEKEIAHNKERIDQQKKDMIELQAQHQLREEELRRKNDNLQVQLTQLKLNGNVSNIIATSCLSSSSSSSSSLSSSSSYDYDRNERRNSIVEKPNVIIKPLKKSWRHTPCDDQPVKTMTTTATANITITTSTPSTIVMMPKTEDIINNNNTKIYNNNNNSSTSLPIINGSTDSTSLDDAIKQKTTTANVSTVVAATPIKTEKL